MERLSRDTLYNIHSGANKPGLVVKPGQEFLAETELCTGDWLKSIDDQFSYGKRKGSPNPTVVVAVEGAKPGDAVIVRIHDIIPDEIGYTGFDTDKNNPLSALIYPKEWGLTTKTVRIKDGFVRWSDKLKLPISPMIGTLGTAPDRGESLLNSKGGYYGGNMDVQEVRAGASVWLPVSVPGALVHIGDVHAIQGDGEICSGGGIECRSVVRLSVDIAEKPAAMNWPRIVDDTHIMTICCHRTLEESFYCATRDLINWMVDDYGFDVGEAYMLLAQVMEARATQLVNPTYSYVCKIAKKYL